MSAPKERSRPSANRRLVRGWVTVVVGLCALAAPLLIGDRALLFLPVLSPMGVFIFIVGVVEIVRGAKQSGEE